MENYSILVNTCDKFEDCWNPFFKLFSIYWPDFKGSIYLNTEYKDYSFPGMNIISIKGSAIHNIDVNKPATWSQCLKWALEIIDTEIILYMQEDYFLKDTVNSHWVEYFFKEILNNREIPCIQLTHAGIPAIDKSNYDKLYTSNSDYFSYLSCQASFWRKDVMLSLIRDHETAWNFEWWGSKRAKYMRYEFLVVDPNWMDPTEFQILPYIFTGVIGGKWYKQVIETFNKNGIVVDYSIRGFFDENKKQSIKGKIKTKISIWKRKSFIEIWKMKLKKI